MRLLNLVCLMLLVCMFSPSCKKKDNKKKGKLTTSLQKSETVSDTSLNLVASHFTSSSGSSVQSFTPTSLKASIFYISACSSEATTNCSTLYKCEENTIDGCAVELSDIDAFADAVNSDANVTDGAQFDWIAVSYCKDGEQDGIQHLSVKGTVDILGTTYATDADKGLVAGTHAEDVSIEVPGGCASLYALDETVTVSKDEPKKITLFFDASHFAVGGVTGGSEHAIDYSYPDNGPGCVGSEDDAFVCVSGVNVVSTVDEGTPTMERYLLADTTESTGGSSTSSPTGMMTLYFSSDDKPIGGVQTSYRVSGSDVSFGQTIGGGLGLYPTVNSDDSLEIGKPGGSISLANWFTAFKRESHSGDYTYEGSGGSSAEGTYTATKLD